MLQRKLSYYAVAISLPYAVLTQVVVAEDITLENKVISCSKINDNQTRLSCFDALISNNSDLAIPVSSINLTQQSIDDFSKIHIKKTQKELDSEIKAITLTIQRLSKNPYGKWIINFENGQKWQQKDSSALNLKVGQHVVLTKGALSAIYLQKQNSTKRIKVQRLK